jgi:hypothetical protein
MGRASLVELHLLFSGQCGWGHQWAEARVQTSSKKKLCRSRYLITQWGVVVGNQSKGELQVRLALVHQLSDGLDCSLHSPIALVIVRTAGDVMDLCGGGEPFEGMGAEAGAVVSQEGLN